MNKKGRPTSEIKKTSINVRVTDEERQELKRLANENNLSLSEYIIKCGLEGNNA